MQVEGDMYIEMAAMAASQPVAVVRGRADRGEHGAGGRGVYRVNMSTGKIAPINMVRMLQISAYAHVGQCTSALTVSVTHRSRHALISRAHMGVHMCMPV